MPKHMSLETKLAIHLALSPFLLCYLLHKFQLNSRCTGINNSIVNIFVKRSEQGGFVPRCSRGNHFLPGLYKHFGAGLVDGQELQQHFRLYLLCAGS